MNSVLGRVEQKNEGGRHESKNKGMNDKHGESARSEDIGLESNIQDNQLHEPVKIFVFNTANNSRRVYIPFAAHE